MSHAFGYAAQSSSSPLAPFSFERREPRDDDVVIKILYCGVCHSDIHSARNEWGRSRYPVVPGHEIIGEVTALGRNVTDFTVGEHVGVGCIVDSCRHCEACNDGLEQYCAEFPTMTYGAVDRHDGTATQGGYADTIVVDRRFVLHVPEGVDLAATAPILCAGITTWSPLRHYKVGKGHRVGVIGMGGLGHMGVKLAKALGAEVTLFTRSAKKAAEAFAQGADHVIVSTDEAQMQAAADRFDFLLDTVPVQHDLNPYLNTLRYNGVHILVGLIEPIEPALHAGNLVRKRCAVVGSMIGGMPETQELLNFCAAHDITCDIEMLDIRDINDGFDRVVKGDVKYRFVIDMASLEAARQDAQS